MAALPSPPTNATDASESKENPQGQGPGQGTGLKATLKPFGKITVHNVLSESGANALQQHIANQNTIIRKIRDFGMLGAVQSAAAAQAQAASSTGCISSSSSSTTTTTTPLSRKRPLGESKQNQQNQQKPPPPLSAAKRSKSSLKKLQTEKTPKTTPQRSLAKVQRQLEQRLVQEQEQQGATVMVVSPVGGTPGRKGLPLPQAVARRNARERNRVKQVNNGFALLREKIPEEVSEAFEAQGAGRGASKKLSKVETLRMAVEYIRSLEKLLGFDFPPLGRCANSSGSGDDSFMFIKDEFDGLDEHFDDSLSNYDMDMENKQQQQQQQHQLPPAVETEESSPNPSVDLLPSLTTLNGMQYIRIPGTNTYQLLTAELLGELSREAGTETEAAASVAISSPCSSPPAVVAEEMLFKQESPPGISVAYGQQGQQQQQQILGSSPILPAFYDQEPVSFYDNVVLPGFKKEFSDILQHQDQAGPGATGGGCLSDESMIDAIDWWEAHTPKSDGGPVTSSNGDTSSAVLL
ncbi:hypothetical protein KR032_006700 [Drosophila birchii]|nr:hypothetical protein KR032_006700 [Drosophila birchii]